MAKIIESRRILKSRLDAKQDVLRAIPALMGDGNGNVAIANQPGYVYIRIGDGDLGQAFNNRCPQRDNLAIYVGYDPVTDPDRRTFQVLSVRMVDYAGSGNTPLMNVPPHHTYHEYGGGDDVYVDWRRLMGLRVGRPSGFSVTTDQGVILRAGVWTAVASQTLALAAMKPAGLQQARYVLIVLNAAGVATATPGALKTIATLAISDCPIPGAGEIPLAAVRLYGIQTAIGDVPSAPDIVDLRFPQSAMTGTVFLSSLSGWARGSIIRGGAAVWEAYAKGAAFTVLTGDGTDTVWSGYLLSGTAGGKTNFAVTNAKTLTFTCADDYNITIPKSGTAVLGTIVVGKINRITYWLDVNTVAASRLIENFTSLPGQDWTATLDASFTADRIFSFPNVTGSFALGAGTLTNITANDATIANHTHAITGSVGLVGNAASQWKVVTSGATPFAAVWSDFSFKGTTGGTVNFAVTNAKTLTFTAANDLNLTMTGGNSTLAFGATGRVYTFPDTAGTVALLPVSNIFTIAQFIQKDTNVYLELKSASDTWYYYPYMNFQRTRGSLAIPADDVATDICGGVNYYCRYGGVNGIGVAVMLATIDTFVTAYPKGIFSFRVNDGLTTGSNYTVFEASNSGLAIPNGTAFTPSTLLHVKLTDATTNAVVNVFTLGKNVTGAGVGADNIGVGMLWTLETSTTVDTSAARIYAQASAATHASRKFDLVLTAWDTAEREFMRGGGSGTAATLTFYGGTKVARGAALTAQLTTITHTAPGTPDYALQDLVQNTGFGFVTKDEGNSTLAVIANLQTRVAELEARLGSATGVNLFA